MSFDRLFAYDDWANREEVKLLRHLGTSAPGLRLLNHIVGAQWIWLSRIRDEKPKLAVWPELTLEQAVAELDRLRDAWRETLRRVDRKASIHYTNSKGEPWSSPIDDVLMHVVMHGAYHRGQIATMVRQGGETPAYTDYIHATRTGAV
ncbi:MAG TPA: DinB family protein [Thermoanaerobaculia bacterium]|nr:DinB family protein [Thermoanaerobaculia bacterium]